MSDFYESDNLVDQYLLFHYGTADDQLPYPFGPRDALFYPIRCVSDFLPTIGTVERALDLGCAVGRSTFELSRWARLVVGIDLSHRFVAAANRVRETGRIEIRRIEEGEIVTQLTRELPPELHRDRCQFEVGDATGLRPDIGGFDVVLAANLIDRVKSPRNLLQSFSDLIHLGGHLTPEKFKSKKNATHDDILFAPHKTPEIKVSQVRMRRNGKTEVLIENFQPADYMADLLT